MILNIRLELSSKRNTNGIRNNRVVSEIKLNFEGKCEKIESLIPYASVKIKGYFFSRLRLS
ncbi:hypothetical protein PUN28_011556 [Cardiocondyla obscurior]|uniref:Ribosomal protein L9 n=1 Tax=Cardiocondyla obscurior TaxID=286306 RepID=A0AAW2FH08_9HYME